MASRVSASASTVPSRVSAMGRRMQARAQRATAALRHGLREAVPLEVGERLF
jgi:hypothetical protein